MTLHVNYVPEQTGGNLRADWDSLGCNVLTWCTAGWQHGVECRVIIISGAELEMQRMSRK